MFIVLESSLKHSFKHISMHLLHIHVFHTCLVQVKECEYFHFLHNLKSKIKNNQQKNVSQSYKLQIQTTRPGKEKKKI